MNSSLCFAYSFFIDTSSVSIDNYYITTFKFSCLYIYTNTKILTENNEALELRVKSLTEKNKLKDNEINELKEENNSLFAELNYFKNKFIRLIQFIKNRLFNRKDRDKYRDFSRDLYEHDVIEDDTIKELNETYKFNKEHDSIKEKDDYDLEI